MDTDRDPPTLDELRRKQAMQHAVDLARATADGTDADSLIAQAKKIERYLRDGDPEPAATT